MPAKFDKCRGAIFQYEPELAKNAMKLPVGFEASWTGRHTATKGAELTDRKIPVQPAIQAAVRSTTVTASGIARWCPEWQKWGAADQQLSIRSK
jgi:hypothetical protein